MGTKRFLGGMLAALASVALLAGVLLYSSPAPAAPSVQWEPSAIVQEVAAGESVTVTASFTASKSLSDVVVRVVPALAPYVTVSPASFGTVSKGGTYELTLTIAAPVDAEIGTYDGTIQLRRGSKPNNTYAKPLPVELDVVWPTFDGGEDLGVTIDHPAGWYAKATTDTLTFSNVDYVPPTRDDTYSFLRVLRLTNVNPSELPVAEWFDIYFSLGFASGPTSKDLLTVAGRDAVRIETIDVGTDAIIYIADKSDVVEVTYSLDTPDFIADYETMLQSLSFLE